MWDGIELRKLSNSLEFEKNRLSGAAPDIFLVSQHTPETRPFSEGVTVLFLQSIYITITTYLIIK